eukprot:6542434-Alexandrium_andersonii.AAC.1
MLVHSTWVPRSVTSSRSCLGALANSTAPAWGAALREAKRSCVEGVRACARGESAVAARPAYVG